MSNPASVLRSRALGRASTFLLALCLTGCFGAGTASERPQGGEVAEPDAGPDGGPLSLDAGRPDDEQEEEEETPSNDCAEIEDPFQRLLCGLGEGGDLQDVIDAILGGGGDMDCSEATDPISALLCSATNGGGLEGLITSILGGGLLGDGGIERVLIGTLSEVIRGILDDLTTALFGGLSGRDAGSRRPPGQVRDAGRVRGNASALQNAGQPSADECAQVAREDLLQRIECARQALDLIDAQLAAE